MTQPHFPSRGVFIPAQIIFNRRLPRSILLTLIQLYALAWDGRVTSPISMQELARLTGRKAGTLNRHMEQLKHLSLLSCHTTDAGAIILSLTGEHDQDIVDKHDPCYSNLQGCKFPEISSYFPEQIMGYITYEELA